ncbi:DUF3575 domain-containing protein [Bacteroides sp. 519]|uniref:DUF3575 domain-containing protein n=1 Tax=Bacteroides sp. 519 TaxID=2302937 RepID=UPI0013D0F080|nr:DUF3575 domain-containing protein [Bacteroides sp. 519]NDV59500.1 DUF3575 domain-containing protein [Bacteroides sp. 519]
MIGRLFLITLFALLPFSGILSQTTYTRYDIPRMEKPAIAHFALKNNGLVDLTLSPNLGFEFRVARRYTVDIWGSYNPWTFPDNKKFKHVFVQPEVRYWLCESFIGHFFGFHPTYSYFNIGGTGPTRALKDKRYEGQLYGAGFSWGYQLYLSPRWNLEFNLGVGYLYIDYDRYQAPVCGLFEKSKDRHYLGITRAGISFVYIIK